jgi:hypothetical protein
LSSDLRIAKKVFYFQKLQKSEISNRKSNQSPTAKFFDLRFLSSDLRIAKRVFYFQKLQKSEIRNQKSAIVNQIKSNQIPTAKFFDLRFLSSDLQIAKFFIQKSALSLYYFPDFKSRHRS